MVAAHAGRRDIDADQLREALKDANVPTLLMVLYQLTGDEHWLNDATRPERCRALDDSHTGGFSEQLQREIRDACAAAVLAWSQGEPPAVPTPRGELLGRMMSHTMGEDVPLEYVPMVEEEMGVVTPPQPADIPDVADLDFTIAVIGAGVSGLTASLRLREAGIKHVVLEKNDRVGGTWLENRYPGCGVDTPSYLYSFTFYRRDWTRHFGRRDEVEQYMQDLARDLDLERNIRFGVEVARADWDEDNGRWTLSLTTAEGEQTLTVDAVVTAAGQLNRPKMPSIAGMDLFQGPVFHSARWPADLDVRGKRVAVIGSGASAMQIVPAIAADVSELYIFQRSPQWIAPNDKIFASISDGVHWLMRHVPYYFEWYRFRLAWTFNDKVHSSLQRDPNWPLVPQSINEISDGHRRYFARYLRAQLEGHDDLIERSLPGYPPFGKRMLLDNGWYTALRRANVELVSEEVSALDAHGVITPSGEYREVDVVVLATGFEAQRPTYPMDIVGTGGHTLREVWHDDDPRAYLGLTTPGFPNLFFLYGPNSNLGHGGSFIFLAEAQTHYLVDLLCAALASGNRVVECRRDVHDKYNREVDAAHERMIWTLPGINTWYRNARGRVVTNMPWRVLDYWRMTRVADLSEYVLSGSGRAAAQPAANAPGIPV